MTLWVQRAAFLNGFIFNGPFRPDFSSTEKNEYFRTTKDIKKLENAIAKCSRGLVMAFSMFRRTSDKTKYQYQLIL